MNECYPNLWRNRSLARLALLKVRNETVMVHWKPTEGGPAFRSLSDWFPAFHASHIGSRWYHGVKYCGRFPCAMGQLILKTTNTSAFDLGFSFSFGFNSRGSLSFSVKEVALTSSDAVTCLEISARWRMPVLTVRVSAVSC